MSGNQSGACPLWAMGGGDDDADSSPDMSFHVANCSLTVGQDWKNHWSVYHDVVMWVLGVACLTLGNGLTAGIVHYEWFGGDPQKRSLGNRLSSHVALSWMAASVTRTAYTLLFRYDVGNLQLRQLAFSTCVYSVLTGLGFINIHTGLRYLQIVVWKRVKEINEDLAVRGLVLSNYAMCLLMTFSLNFGQPFFMGILPFRQGQHSIAVPNGDCMTYYHPFRFRYCVHSKPMIISSFL